MLKLRNGVEASSTLAAQISVSEAERMMKDTTIRMVDYYYNKKIK